MHLHDMTLYHVNVKTLNSSVTQDASVPTNQPNLKFYLYTYELKHWKLDCKIKRVSFYKILLLYIKLNLIGPNIRNSTYCLYILKLPM